MNLVSQVKKLEGTEYRAFNGKDETIFATEGLTDREVALFRRENPWLKLSHDYWDLLSYSRSLILDNSWEIQFAGARDFSHDRIFPRGICLMDDGFGGHWILDVDKEGRPGKVYFWNHDPDCIVLLAGSLREFFEVIREYTERGNDSLFIRVYAETCRELWGSEDNILRRKECMKSDDEAAKKFFQTLPPKYSVLDLRNVMPGDGVSLRLFFSHVHSAVRHETLPMWGIKETLFLPDKIKRLLRKMGILKKKKS